MRTVGLGAVKETGNAKSEKLQNEVNKLKKENAVLRKEIEALDKENAVLHEENAALKDLKSQDASGRAAEQAADVESVSGAKKNPGNTK
ncbi:MAG: hypothetical protein NC399_06430 [Muribaculum sp.]|nr:hypothetical protein [Muribaculum sp.]